MDSEKEKAIKILEEQGYKVSEPSEQARKSFDEIDYIQMLQELCIRAFEEFGRPPLNLFQPEILLMHPATFSVFAKQYVNVTMMMAVAPGYPTRKQIVVNGWVLNIYESLDVEIGKMIIK